MLDEALKNTQKRTVGLKQTLRVLEKGLVSRIYVARDAEAHLTRPLMELCKAKAIEIVDVPTMKELGKACGIEVGAAVAAILKDA